MRYKQLGRSNLEISTIGFGCMSLGRDQQQNDRLLADAIEQGINFFDTADLYDKGWNEETVGRALKSYRNKIILATKVGNVWRANGSGWDWNASKKYITAAVEKSLQRLGTDHIDLYQLHGGMLSDPIDETIDAFEQLKSQGKIRYYGISSIRPNVIRAYVQRSSVVSVMMQYSLLDRRPEESCFQLLQENRIGLLCRGALAQGLLAGKPAKPYLGYSEADVTALAATVAKVSNPQRTAAQVAIQFAQTATAVTSVVAGIRNADQLKDIAGASTATALDKSERETLSSIRQANLYTDHR